MHDNTAMTYSVPIKTEEEELLIDEVVPGVNVIASSFHTN